MVFTYKPNSRIKAPAQVAGEMCEDLLKTGALTPKRLLDANRAEGTPLHNEFEWDDSIAAEAYREKQAAHIIRCIVVKSETKESEPTRAYVKVTDNVGEYTPIRVVMSDEKLIDSLLKNARWEMECFIKKYNNVERLRNVIDEMNIVLEKEKVI